MNSLRCELTYSNCMVGIVIRRAINASKHAEKRIYLLNDLFKWKSGVLRLVMLTRVSEVEV